MPNEGSVAANCLTLMTTRDVDTPSQNAQKATENTETANCFGVQWREYFSMLAQEAFTRTRSDAEDAEDAVLPKAYAELGLQFLFTPHLALGVRGNVLASRYSSDYTQNGTTARTTSYSLSLGSPQVVGAFYF